MHVSSRVLILSAALFAGWNGNCAGQSDPFTRKKAGSTWQTTGDRTIFQVNDHAVLKPVTSGKWKLGGVLEIQFTGQIAPHESSVLQLFAPGVDGIQGRFEKVILPEGWLYDLKYGEKEGTVTLANLRPNRAPAFPGAEGFGKYTIGGRGGRVIEVTNLNDSGPGSFRAACAAEEPRTIVFRISGTIPLQSKFKIVNPYLTIAGQTAPGDGICIKNFQVNFETKHMIIRYVRFRPGDEKGKEQDGFGGKGDHLIIDHCSASWGIDETFSINKGANSTVQWCMVTESLSHSLHKKGDHGYGGLWGGPGGSWHHNILAHHSSRNPRASGNKESGLLDYRNNVIYNWGFQSAYGGELWQRNWINNYYKNGPATSENVRRRIFEQNDMEGKMFADGNFVTGYPGISADNWKGGIDYADNAKHPEKGVPSEATLRVKQPFVVAP